MIVELKGNEFIRKHPAILLLTNLSNQMLADILTDDEYIARMDTETGAIEFGYPGDDWTLHVNRK